MTEFIDTHIPLDPRAPDAIDPALVYLSWVAWPHPTAEEQDNRDRLMNAVVGAVYKSADNAAGNAGQQMPAVVPRVKLENISPTFHRAIKRIHQRRLPAALMMLSRWSEQGRLDLSQTSLTAEQKRALADLLLRAAGRLRPSGPERPTRTDDLGEEVWEDSRPALAMTMALPLWWGGMAFRRAPYAEYGALMNLFLDPSWIANAVYEARTIALVMDQSSRPPPALLVPRRRIVRTNARLFKVRLDLLRDLTKPRVAEAPEVACRAPSRWRRKS
jgi:hypothetical protein